VTRTSHRPRPITESQPLHRLPGITVVIPARNEEGTLPLTLPGVVAAMDALPVPSELVVVTPPSSPLLREPPLEDGRIRWRAVERPGKFEALRAGVQMADGELLVLVDADVLVGEHTLCQLVEPLLKGAADVVAARISYLSAPRTGVQRVLDGWSLVSALAWDRLRADHPDLRWALPGAMYAIRRPLFPAEPLVALVDDASIGLHAFEAGAPFAYVPRAVAWTAGPATYCNWIRAKLRSRRGWAALAAVRSEAVTELEATLRIYIRSLAGQVRLGGLMLAQDRLLRLAARHSLRRDPDIDGEWEPARPRAKEWPSDVVAR